HLALPGRGLRERWWRLHPALPGGPADRGHPAAVPGLRDRASLARLGAGFLAALPPLDGVHRLVAGAHLRDHRLLLRADPGLGADPAGFFGSFTRSLEGADATVAFDYVPAVLITCVLVWLAVIAVMVFGVQKGIAGSAMVFIPLLVIMFIILVVRALMLPGAL